MIKQVGHLDESVQINFRDFYSGAEVVLLSDSPVGLRGKFTVAHGSVSIQF